MTYKDLLFNYLSTFALVSRGKPLVTPETPYIEWDLIEDSFATSFIQGLPIYHIGTNVGYGSIDTIVNNLKKDIGEGGKLLTSNDINIKIYKGSPFYQDRQMGEENVKAGYINLQIEIFEKGE